MNKVVVDKASMTVTAHGGCLIGDVDTAADKEGLSVVMAPLTGIGIGGVTVGGGTGVLTGQYGHIVDNLLSARVALADGTIVIASPKSNSDLFWAIRGGGSNFGVCTEFTYRAHRQGPIVLGFLKYAPDKLQKCLAVASSLQTDAAEASGGKFQAYLTLPNTTEDTQPSPTYMFFYDGPESEARSFAAPLFDIGPFSNSVSVHPYSAFNNLYRRVPQNEACQRYAITMVEMHYPLDIPILKSSIDYFREIKAGFGNVAPMTDIIIELRSSLVTSSVPVSATAYANRGKSTPVCFKMQYAHADLDRPVREGLRKMTRKVRDWSQDAELNSNLQAGVGKKAFIHANYSSGEEKLEDVFGENLPRLIQLKREFDPDFLFNKWYPLRAPDT